jgi:hypothetical protein
VRVASLPGIVSLVGLVVAVVGAVAGLGFFALGEGFDAISDNTEANLGVVSILCSLIAIPIGVIGWRWAERRRARILSWAGLRGSLVLEHSGLGSPCSSGL